MTPIPDFAICRFDGTHSITVLWKKRRKRAAFELNHFAFQNRPLAVETQHCAREWLGPAIEGRTITLA
jgi:hypothetical protein